MIPGAHKLILIFIILIYSFALNAKPIEADIAIIQILDKITAKVKVYKIRKNQNLILGSLSIEIYSCFTNPPQEIPEDYVLLRVYDYMNLKDDQLIYQGWMISSTPGSTPLEHPIYELLLKDCKMETDF
jgi:hypothetical protein